MKLILMLLTALAPLFAQAQQNAPAKASELIGMEIRNPDTGDTGRIDDLVVDVANSRVHFVMLDMPGSLVTQPLAALELGQGGAALHAATDWRFAAPKGIALMLASSLVGSQVDSVAGAPLGTIADLAVDPVSGAIAFATVRLKEDPQRLLDVPLDAFKLSARRGATAAAGGSQRRD
ncbi:MAG TPA: PRC-barrel domain-containing protein [Burkholderiales bacterium]